jgi:hypothetical protein
MAKHWEQIGTDEILNFEDAHTGLMARYERIMRHREIEALNNVHSGLFDVKKTIHQKSDGLEKRLESLEQVQAGAAKTQGRLGIITIALTVVIASATVAYTWVTWKAVQVQREANEIQEQVLSTSGDSSRR